MIKNIIFDLGGVIIDLDAAATSRAFAELGAKDFEKHYTFAKQSGIFDEFDKGSITEEEFRNELRKFLRSGVSDEQIDHAWNAMLIGIPRARLDLLKEAGKQFRIFLLSNTNVIHTRFFSDPVHETFLSFDPTNFFERWYYSCEIHMRKPDREIFEFVLEANKLVAEETLFIDDAQQHVTGAAQCGIHTKFLRVKDGEDLISWWKKENFN
ncbi:MAG: HAD family phosphatase [Bacteroidetes bacterium]|nr:HAD family phosphatase [Bacteroidota bacterium]